MITPFITTLNLLKAWNVGTTGWVLVVFLHLHESSTSRLRPQQNISSRNCKDIGFKAISRQLLDRDPEDLPYPHYLLTARIYPLTWQVGKNKAGWSPTSIIRICSWLYCCIMLYPNLRGQYHRYTHESSKLLEVPLSGPLKNCSPKVWDIPMKSSQLSGILAILILTI